MANSIAWRVDTRTGHWGAVAALLALLGAVLVYRSLYLLGADYDLFVDEAQYWLWAQAPDWGYYSKPPLTAWVIAATTALCGDGEACIRAPAVLAYPLAALALFALGRALGGARAGWIAAALFLSMPGQALGGWVMTPDALLLLCWSIALWLLHRAAIGQAGLATWLALGLVLGLGALAKYSMLVFVLGLAWLAYAQRGERTWRGPGPWLALALAAVLLLPNLVWNAANDFETLRHTADLARAEQAGLKPGRLAEFVLAQALVFGPVAFVLLLGALWRRDAAGGMLLKPFVIPYLVAITLLALVSGANANWAVAAYAAGAVLVALRLAAPDRQRLLAWTLATNVLLALAVAHYRDVAPGWVQSLAQGRDLHSRVLGWRELGAALAPVVRAHGAPPLLASERTLLAELAYYVAPRPYPVFALDTDGMVSNHYELETRRAGLPPRALWVSQRAAPPELARHYARRTPLGTVTASVAHGPTRTLEVWLVERTR